MLGSKWFRIFCTRTSKIRQAVRCFITKLRWIDKFIHITHGKMDTVDQEKNCRNKLTYWLWTSAKWEENHGGSLTAQVNQDSGAAFLAEEQTGISWGTERGASMRFWRIESAGARWPKGGVITGRVWMDLNIDRGLHPFLKWPLLHSLQNASYPGTQST